jgi:peptide/nickel transport system ATP-binding protein
MAAGPRYDKPNAGLEPVPQSIFEQLRAEIGIT